MGILKTAIQLATLKTAEKAVKHTADAISDYKKNVRYVYTPCSSDDFEGRHFLTVCKELKAYGFEHVSLLEKKDLRNNWINKGENGKVTEIMIDGKTKFKEKAKFRSDVQVTVTYHSFKEPKKK